MAGQFITFQPGKNIKQAIKWYPVLATKVIPETKSLSYLGKTKLPIGLLLLLNYEKNYLCHHIHYHIQFHMTVPLQMQCLLFMLSISPDADLHTMIGERLTSITLCDDSPLINIFETSDHAESLLKQEKITISNFFPDFLCVNCKDSIQTDNETAFDNSWNSAMISVLMNHNWTETSNPSLIPPNQPTTEKRISKDSSPYYGKRSLTATTTGPSKISRQEREPIILSAPSMDIQQSSNQPLCPPDGNSECSNDVVTDSVFQYDESVSFSTNRTRQFSNQTTTTTTAESTSPSILSNLNITAARELPRIRENLFCCKNEAIAKKVTSLSYMEFINQKEEYCKILKDISIKSKHDRMYFYLMDSSIHVKTNSFLLQIQNIKKIQYVICEGYKNSLIFCDYLLTVENFMYFLLLSQAQIVSLHTVANLSMNHLSRNRLPLYMSLNQTNESKFVRTFLKLSDFELHYTSIKHRIAAIIKHNDNCNLFKK